MLLEISVPKRPRFPPPLFQKPLLVLALAQIRGRRLSGGVFLNFSSAQILPALPLTHPHFFFFFFLFFLFGVAPSRAVW